MKWGEWRRHCDIALGCYEYWTQHCHLITEMSTKWLRGGQHIQHGYAAQGADSCPRGQSKAARDFILLLRMVCNLKFMCCLFLGFFFNICAPWLTAGNWNRGKHNQGEGGLLQIWKLVKILSSQGQTLALVRMLMTFLQTNSFKANNQIWTKLKQTTPNIWFIWYCKRISQSYWLWYSHFWFFTNPLQHFNIHATMWGQFSSKR